MKIRKFVTAAGAALVLSGAGAFLVPGVASAHTTTHTLKFTAVLSKQAVFSKTAEGQTDDDLNRAHKVVGFDLIYVTFNFKTDTASGSLALETKGGFLYGTLKLTSSPVTHGRVTGGTGMFRGATGSIVGKSLNKTDTRTAVTITYST